MRQHTFSKIEKIIIGLSLTIALLTAIFTIHPIKIQSKSSSKLSNDIVEILDKATIQIIVNHSPDGSLSKLYKLYTKEEFNTNDPNQAENLGKLYEKYLNISNQKCNSSKQCGKCATYDYNIQLQNSACIGLTTGVFKNDVLTIFPGEESPSLMRPTHGVIFVDINGIKPPNVLGKDQFVLPLGQDGIEYGSTEN
ncbi:hypothetical protein IJ670_04575 [bacterium]|nr:hypothetical protein [bacterium]